MFRSLYLFALIALLALGAVWLANNPGVVSLRWDEYVIETNMVVLALAALILALILAVLIVIYRWLRASPGKLGGVFASRRRSKGMDAISHGMVAIASGNANEARRAAIEAEKHLKGSPMTLLLAAQAAELNKDERATEIYYGKLAENPETEFLGLRGLIGQAKRENKLAQAVELAERADRLKPGTDWVLQELLSLNVKLRNFEAANLVLDRNIRGKLAKDPKFIRLRAVILYERAMEKLIQSDVVAAKSFLQASRTADPTFIPTATRLITLSDDDRKQEKLISGIWSDCPHPDVAAAIKNLVPLEGESDWYARARKLFLQVRPDHRDSLLVLAKAAMTAREWGDARKFLNALIEADPTVSVYRLLADLEEKANADAIAARKWIQKSTEAKADPEWHCKGCGRQEVKWTPICGSCGQFDSYVWKSPDRGDAMEELEAQMVHELPST